LKPTRGRNSWAPAGDAIFGLAVEHAVTRSVRDTAAILDAIADLRDRQADPPALRPPLPGSRRTTVRVVSASGNATLKMNLWRDSEGKDVRLGPTEQARLLVFNVAELARRQRDRGLRLNAPEAIALACDEMHMAARQEPPTTGWSTQA
jgi:Asp-tRNA(Asn)/Glu-tRNA(Gln) amidotransferase A subunit family amidase